MRISWRDMDENTSYGAAISDQGLDRYHLIVERLPNRQSWDWAAWQKGMPRSPGRQGLAVSSSTAKANAEAVVKIWNEGLLDAMQSC